LAISAVLVLVLRLAMAIALYAFVGWAFYTLWRSLQQQSEDLALRRVPALTICLEGEDRDRARHFSTNEVIIGRGDGCDYAIPDETISARHARLSFHHRQWWVEDLFSTNGTYLNQEPLVTSAVIISGDELRCGQVNLLLTIGKE
jgi:pSer/pThr/pTyr-binding forkhead associated (FHA) protein